MKTSKQVEKELQELIKKYSLAEKLSVEIVKQWVYEESGPAMAAVQKFQGKFFECFDEAAAGVDALNEALQAANDAWNYFPHRTLGGKSPNQMVKK